MSIDVTQLKFENEAKFDKNVYNKGLTSVEALGQNKSGLNIFYFDSLEQAKKSVDTIKLDSQVTQIKISDESECDSSSIIQLIKIMNVDILFDFDRNVHNTKNPFDDDGVFPERPEFFGDDTPESLAKKIYQKCKNNWFPNHDFEANFEQKLSDLFEKWWPVKNNPMDIEAFLFGWECGSRITEGFNTFDYEQYPEIFESFKSFKDAIEDIIDSFGWNETDNICSLLSDMDVDQNEYHHKYDMPSDAKISEWYQKILDEKNISNKQNLTLKDLKDEAYQLKISQNMVYSEALERVARKHGFQHFHEANKNLRGKVEK